MLRKPADTASRDLERSEHVRGTSAAVTQLHIPYLPRVCCCASLHRVCCCAIKMFAPCCMTELRGLALCDRDTSRPLRAIQTAAGACPPAPPQCSRTPHADSRMLGGLMVVLSLVNWLGRVSEAGSSLPARMGWLSCVAFCPIWPKAMTCTAHKVVPACLAFWATQQAPHVQFKGAGLGRCALHESKQHDPKQWGEVQQSQKAAHAESI